MASGPIKAPTGYTEAATYVDSLEVLTSSLTSAQWADVDPAITERAFFSSQVEDANFLNQAKALITDALNRRDENGKLRPGSRTQFANEMREFMAGYGVGLDPEMTANDIRQPLGSSRLRLIFETNMTTARGYAKYRRGMEPHLLRRFPAWRFHRRPGAKEKRPIHEANENRIELKTSRFWHDMNDPDKVSGGLGHPYPAFGFNSRMDQRNVSRREALRLGILKEGQRQRAPKVGGFNEGLEASIDRMDPEIREAFLKHNKGQLRRIGKKVELIPLPNIKKLNTRTLAGLERLGPRTAEELAVAMKTTTRQATQALQRLRRQGKVELLGTIWRLTTSRK